MNCVVYETMYGNCCIVDKDDLKKRVAFDLDMQEYIPIEMVDVDNMISENIEDYETR